MPLYVVALCVEQEAKTPQHAAELAYSKLVTAKAPESCAVYPVGKPDLLEVVVASPVELRQ